MGMMKEDSETSPIISEPPRPSVSKYNNETEAVLVAPSDINENDVLCGRGAFANRHTGNRRFRELVASYQESYVSAKILEKSQIASTIVEIISSRQPSGRFLKRETNSADGSEKNDEEASEAMWRVISDRCSKDKTSQALREKAPDARRRLMANRQALSPEHFRFPPMGPIPHSMHGERLPLRPMVDNRPISAQSSPLMVPDSPPFMERASAPAMCTPEWKDGAAFTPSRNRQGVDCSSGIEINDNDVLCGRGGVTNSHLGNRQFRSLVKARQPAYIAAPKLEKANIARDIVKTIRSLDPPGRFLMKNEKEGTWYDVGNEKAREKTSQALREKAPEIRSMYSAAASLVDTKGDTKKPENYVSAEQVASFGTPIRTNMAPMPHNYNYMQHSPERYHDTRMQSMFAMSRDKYCMPPIVSHPNPEEFNSRPYFGNTEQFTYGPNAPSPYTGYEEERRSPVEHMDSAQNQLPDAEGKVEPNQGDAVTAVNDNDVLFGRGAGVNYHAGNRRFREIVRSHQHAYLAAAKLDKAGIARSIVELVRRSSPSGRFLMKHPKQEGAWMDVGDERAREKTSQALREGAPVLKKHSRGGYGSPAMSPTLKREYQDVAQSTPGGFYGQHQHGMGHPAMNHSAMGHPSVTHPGMSHGNTYGDSSNMVPQQANDQWILCNERPPPRFYLREAERGPFLKRRRIGPKF